ncbi:MAG: DUF6040 family protein [Fusicatenibacter saccharivorans]
MDYLLCGNLPYPAWKKHISVQNLSNRRIRRYLVCRLKRPEARDFSHVRFTGLIYPTYDNGFNQKIAYTGGEVWVIRILAIVAVLFILAIVMIITVEVVKRYKEMWDEISQMFLIGSLSGIAVLGNVIREYLPVNLILLFVFINMGVVLLRVYLRKKFEYM